MNHRTFKTRGRLAPNHDCPMVPIVDIPVDGRLGLFWQRWISLRPAQPRDNSHFLLRFVSGSSIWWIIFVYFSPTHPRTPGTFWWMLCPGQTWYLPRSGNLIQRRFISREPKARKAIDTRQLRPLRWHTIPLPESYMMKSGSLSKLSVKRRIRISLQCRLSTSYVYVPNDT